MTNGALVVATGVGVTKKLLDVVVDWAKARWFSR
jgi:hypothetical protein